MSGGARQDGGGGGGSGGGEGGRGGGGGGAVAPAEREERNPGGSDGMVAGVVIHTLPGRAAAVAERLATVPGLDPKGDDGDARLAAVWTAPDARSLRSRAEALVAEDEEILGIYPTFAAEVPVTDQD